MKHSQIAGSSEPSLCHVFFHRAQGLNLLRVAEDDGLVAVLRDLKKLRGERRLKEAVWFVDSLYQQGIDVSTNVYCCLLQACINKEDLTVGREIYSRIVKIGFNNIFLWNHLIQMFASCGSLSEANSVFSKLPKPNVFTWTAVILAHANVGQAERAMKLYHQMQQAMVKPDTHVFVAVLKACANASDLTQGRHIHADIKEIGLETDVFVGNSLINMYAKCQSLKDAGMVFNMLPKRDAVTWGAMIAGYTQHGFCQEALQLFQQMREEAIEPNRVTFICILKACSRVLALDQGKWIHKQIIESHLGSDVSIGNTLIDMYAKCGSFADACTVFHRLPKRDMVTWSVMIEGCDQHGHGEKALCLFQQMLAEVMEPDRVTFFSVLKACSSTAALELGKLIHAHIIQIGLESELFIGNTLIDMYAKCGSLRDAHRVFDRLAKQDIVGWNAIIGGCAQHSDCGFALRCFEEIQRDGLKPNDVTITSLLSTCSHVGLLDEGVNYFRLLTDHHGVVPTLDHHNCMVSLLGHAGRFKDAEDLLQSMPFGPNIVGWMALLSHCKIHGDVEQGQRCFDQLVTMDNRKSAGYVLMSQMYANSGLQKDADRLDEMRTSANAWKKPAKAFIEIDNVVHDFIMGCQNHPLSHHVYAKLRRLSAKIKVGGYMPQFDFLQQSIPDGDRECHM